METTIAGVTIFLPKLLFYYLFSLALGINGFESAWSMQFSTGNDV